METTSASLLERLRQPNQHESWARFSRLYFPLLFGWARRLGLQDQDAADLVQDVLLTVVKKFPEFNRDRTGSFRKWLNTIMLNHRRDQLRRRKLPTDGTAAIANLPDPATGVEEVEYRRQLVCRALQIMQSEFSGKTWKACWEHVVNARPAAEVAAELGICPGSVYVAKARVLGRLRDELNGLLD